MCIRDRNGLASGTLSRQPIITNVNVAGELITSQACLLYTSEKINQELDNIIKTYQPEAMAIEELFFNNNAKTAINVAQARGVILITARQNNLNIYEYTPLQVKQAVTGYGRADKIQVQRMVKMILNEEKLPKLDDITDSMAMAICHAHSSKFAQKL